MNYETLREELLSVVSATKNFDELKEVLVKKIAAIFKAEVCTLWRVYTDNDNKKGLRLLAASASAPQTLAEDLTYKIYKTNGKYDGITGYVAYKKIEAHAKSFKELKSKYRFCHAGKMDSTQWQKRPDLNFHSLSAFPLLLGKDLLGVLKVENKKITKNRYSINGFSQQDQRNIRNLLPDIALIVHNYILLDNHVTALIDVPVKMVSALLKPYDPNQLITEIVKTVKNLLNAEICSLWMVDTSGKKLHLAHGEGFEISNRSETYDLIDSTASDKEIDGITAWVAIRKKPFWANSKKELEAHPSWRGKWDKQMWHQARHFRCLYSVPLINQGEVIGVLKVENKAGDAFFNDSDRALCNVLTSLIVLILELGYKLRTDLISDLGHTMRSPIAQASLNLTSLEKELLKKENINYARIEKFIEFIKKALLSVTVTSRTLQAYAQSPKELSANHDLHPESLSNLLYARIVELRPLLTNGITINENFTASNQSYNVNIDVIDQTRVSIAFDNILSNAIKYSKENGIVHVNIESTDNSYIISITDDGVGISKNDLPRIFEAGFTRRAKDHPQGTGMGLASVKQCFDRLKWKIDVESTLDVGTCFKIEIPLKSEMKGKNHG